MKKLARYFFCIFFLLLAAGIQGQELNYLKKTFTTADGLSNDYVRRIAQDKYGFLWIATWDGISRYDGHAFKNYFHDPNDSTSLPYFEINDLCIDKENIVWVFAKRLCHYDYNSDNFVSYNQGFKNHIASNDIYSITTDSEGSFYVLGNMGLEKFNYSKHRFDLFSFIDKFGKNFNIQGYYCISIDNNKLIWIFNESKKILIRGKLCNSVLSKTSFIEVQNEYTLSIPKRKYSNFQVTFDIHTIIDDSFILTTNLGLYIKSRKSKKFVKSNLKDL